MPEHLLFTTGYSKFKGQDFLWKMQHYGVEVVVDVRDNAKSRNRDFTQSQLKPLLEEGNVAYIHFQSLGVPAEIRRANGNKADRGQYFSEYRAHLAAHEEALEELRRLVCRKRCCLLCLETDPDQCHRSVLAQVLADNGNNGLEVRHI